MANTCCAAAAAASHESRVLGKGRRVNAWQPFFFVSEGRPYALAKGLRVATNGSHAAEHRSDCVNHRYATRAKITSVTQT